MKRILFIALLALPCAAFAQARIEADAGAANLLSVAKTDYERAKSAGRIEAVLANSTAGAIAKLCRGEIAVAGAARLASQAERSLCAQACVNTCLQRKRIGARG